MKLQILLIALVVIVSCGDSGDPPPEEPKLTPPGSLNVLDVANAGDGSDFELSFSKPTDLTLVAEFRIYLVKATNAAVLDSLTAIQLSPDFYLAQGANAPQNQIPFKADLTDIDGDLAIEGVDYNFFVLAVGIDDLGGELSNASNTIRLEQKSAVRSIGDSFNAGSGGMDVDAEGNIYMGDFGAALSGAPGTRV